MEQIVIIGAGGFGREVLWLIEEINRISPTYIVSGFVDDNEDLHGSSICGVPVLGGIDFLRDWNGKSVALGIGIPTVKEHILSTLSNLDLQWPCLISPTAQMSEYVDVGAGSIITSGSILTTQIKVGSHVLINLACTIGHDVVISDGCTLSPGVSLSGNVSVGKWTDVGTGAVVIPGVDIGDNAIIGAGTVVIRDVPDGATVVGNPGRVIKVREDLLTKA